MVQNQYRPTTTTGQSKMPKKQTHLPTSANKRLRQQPLTQQTGFTAQIPTNQSESLPTRYRLGAQKLKPKYQVQNKSANFKTKVLTMGKQSPVQKTLPESHITKHAKMNNEVAWSRVLRTDSAIKRQSIINKIKIGMAKFYPQQYTKAGEKKTRDIIKKKKGEVFLPQTTKKGLQLPTQTHVEPKEKSSASTLRNEDVSANPRTSGRGRGFKVLSRRSPQNLEKPSLLKERFQNPSVETLTSPENVKAKKQKNAKAKVVRTKAKAKPDRLELLNESVKINSMSVETLLSPQEVKILQSKQVGLVRKAGKKPKKNNLVSAKVEMLKSTSPINKKPISKTKRVLKPIDERPSTSKKVSNNSNNNHNKDAVNIASNKKAKICKVKQAKTSSMTTNPVIKHEKSCNSKFRATPMSAPVYPRYVRDVLEQKRILQSLAEEHQKLRRERAIIAKEMEDMHKFFHDLQSELKHSVDKMWKPKGLNPKVSCGKCKKCADTRKQGAETSHALLGTAPRTTKLGRKKLQK